MNLRARVLHGITLLAAAGLAQAAPLGYVVNSDSPNPDNADSLFQVDLATGDESLIGPTGYIDVEGLAISPEGVLYGVDDATDTLIILDTQTGEGRPVDNTPGNLGIPIGVKYDFGLTFDAEGNLWLSSDTTGDIWRVNPQTGAATPVYDAGISATAAGSDGIKSADNPGTLSGLAACGTRLVGVGVTGDERLYRVPGDGSGPERVGDLGGQMAFTDAGLAFAPNGELYGIADLRTDFSGGALNEPSTIFTIDPETGAATPVSATLIGVESLAIAPPEPDCAAQEAAAPAIPAVSGPVLAALALLLAALGAPLLRQRRTTVKR